MNPQQADLQDPLQTFRKKFRIPSRQGKEQIYFLGNSLGLQPITAAAAIHEILEQWAYYGVEGFFEGDRPWMHLHEQFTGPLSAIVGALPSEVVVMNQLTVNLHLLMGSFYRPTPQRYRILCEAKAFPSDQYMLESQVRLHGFDPDDAIIEISPREGEYSLRTDDILEAIERHGDEMALVLMGGVNYYTGQVLPMAVITEAAHKAGALAAFDLAHAAGNVMLQLHEWNVDFACWCSYKYLNSGPGAVAGAFIHERFHRDVQVPRLAGWWGNRNDTRFLMEKTFDPEKTASGWQVSTPSPILYAAHKASLDVFSEAGMDRLVEKGKQLSSYLMALLKEINSELPNSPIEIITPEDHGCQVSLSMGKRARSVFEQLSGHGIFADWREPGIIRVAPVPLYNTFGEVHEFAQTLKKILS